MIYSHFESYLGFGLTEVDEIIPQSKVHGVNMGPTWVLSAPDGPHVGPMNLAIRKPWSNNACCLSYTAIPTMHADALATLGARVSAIMVLFPKAGISRLQCQKS